MMFQRVFSIVSALLISVSLAYAGAEELKKASKLISQRNYDEAIHLLKQELQSNPDSAKAHLYLARAYHWKKELQEAKGHYLAAAKINPGYNLEIIPLLDELKEWANIIKILEPEWVRGNKTPSLLGALASAYNEMGNRSKADKVMKALMQTNYKSDSDNDYKNYVLAYYYLWDNNLAASKEHLKKIRSRGYLKYARTSFKFKKLFNDPEFLEMTK